MHFESTYRILNGKTQGICIEAQGLLPLLIINYKQYGVSKRNYRQKTFNSQRIKVQNYHFWGFGICSYYQSQRNHRGTTEAQFKCCSDSYLKLLAFPKYS